ncbi:uncharacterized protein LOC142802662 [Rhipicephalus microplus]|uniref:uncharacterized protein LOC142802662 n=1 Tax=Rhipicephalus microplus TaxID=6941 RepID=UPI003F6AF713
MALREDAVPVVHPARRVPLALREPLRQELERMETASIIKKVDEPTEWFVPGKELVLADMLSRAPMPSQSSSAFTDVDIHATEVVSGIVSTPMKVRLEKKTRNDPYLSEVRERISRGDAVEGELKPFAGVLSVVEGTLLKGCKVVIPKAMRAEILRRIHYGHLGLNKCKARARRLAFWPGLSSAINSFIRGCSTCQRYAYKQPTYRSSPLEDGRSPGELLHGRHLRTTLPEYQGDPGTTVEKRRQSSKGKALPPLGSGTAVLTHNGHWSRTATVSEQAAPRSYTVKTEDQRMLRRNRQHLLRIPGNGTSEDEDQDADSPENMVNRDKSQDSNTPGERAHGD